MLEGFYNIRVQSDVRRVNKGASFSKGIYRNNRDRIKF